MYWKNLRLAWSFFIHAMLGGKCVFSMPKPSEVEEAMYNRRLPRTISASFTAIIHENTGPTNPVGGYTFEDRQ